MSPRLSLFASTFLVAAAWCGVASAEAVVAAAADVSASEVQEVEGLVVTGDRARTSAVIGLDLSLRETPQSVTQITQERIRQFALTDVNTLLVQSPGVNVEKVETDRTYYNSRGFDITNFQVDGIGLPLIWGIQFGDLDTVLFDRVEIVRGANSMMTGTGNPSATVNYIRKRPTAERRGNLAVQYGSWSDLRLEADVSGPLNADGSVRGRLIYANQDRESYLDHYRQNRNVYGALLAWDATPKLTATAGWSMNDNRSKGNLWGALPLLYSDGTRVDYPVSASTSADWTYWNVRDQTAFGELDYRFDNGWSLKGVATYKRFEEEAKLLYAYGNPDPVTGLGVAGMSGIYPSEYESWIVDGYASGPFELFGRTHQAVIGGQASESNSVEYENFSPDTVIYPAIGQLGRAALLEPSYPGAYRAEDELDRLYRLYAAAHLEVTDRLKLVVGANWLKVKTKGFSYGVDAGRDESQVSPYLGAVFDLSDQVSLYASYTDIFNPQSEVDVNRQRLPPAHGKSYEAGVKSEWFDRRLYATAAVFKAEQADLAEFAGTFADSAKSYYAGVDTEVTGYELEAVGALNDNWSVSAGWTQLEIEGEDGSEIRLYTPRKTLKLMATYAVPELRDLTLGAALRWQDDIEGMDLLPVTQDAYGLLDLSAAINLTEQVRATVNVRNVTDEKHLNSLMWAQSYYGAPRSVFLRLDYNF
ncbi:TonB-dependent siderophore receptor [Phenylobacterium deserti]|uniref:TonB-dependent siderophore receptor n=1 Tax=Phenylobacterium deserti TaxID=1914756 RepID=A0A328AA15_9CAUL|nr:TonB-dependent siderophore receptor [Phenylobacterium deserti]RAK51431.1 TonB-dependent siderophore receptor [Phenylobacterium deserti]